MKNKDRYKQRMRTAVAFGEYLRDCYYVVTNFSGTKTWAHKSGFLSTVQSETLTTRQVYHIWQEIDDEVID